MDRKYHKPNQKFFQVKSVWISDVHLGSKDCKAEFLLDFLQLIECETLYLVGDIIDFYALKRSFYWPDSHNNVLRQLMKIAKADCKVIYIPGNHDEQFRTFVGEKFGDIEVHRHYIHVSQNGHKLLVMHGDELDQLLRFSKIATLLGESAYDFLMMLNRTTNVLRYHMGYGYWSMASYVKTRLAKSRQIIEIFEQNAMNWAKRHGCDGIICGHIHHANLRQEEGILYCNDGDWVESCTALVETEEGELKILHYSDFYHMKKHIKLAQAV